MTEIVTATRQLVRAAKILKMLNDVDRLPTEQYVLDLAALDPATIPVSPATSNTKDAATGT